MKVFVAIPILMAAGLVHGRDGQALRPKLTIDSRDPDRSGPTAGYADIVDRVAPSVVSILVESRGSSGRNSNQIPEDLDPFLRRFFEGMRPEFRQQIPQRKRQAEGSGVVVTSDGYILTNNHVVEGADKVQVILANGRDKYKGEVIGRDPGTDVALLKIEATNLPVATLGDSSKLRVGDTVIAIGSPFGLSQTVTTGIVSALKRTNLGITGARGYESFIQTDASINPGNSGGPLIDHQGRVVGINTAIFGATGGNIGIGFAIPINMAVDILDKLQTKGEVERGYLGLLLGEMTPELAEGWGIEARGVLVNDVVQGGPAEKAGFKQGDVILSFQGQKVPDMADLRMMVANTQPGTVAKFDILRGGKPQTISATIGKLPTDGKVASGGRQGQGGGDRSQEFLTGVQVTGLSDDLRNQLNIPDDVKGVVIGEVEPGSPAADAGLAQGQVIRRVGDREISSVQDAVNAAKEARGKRLNLLIYDGEVSRYVSVAR